MNRLDVEAIRAQVRALDFTRGTPADAAMWSEDDADARANLAIEGMDLDADEHALFDMLRDEAVPPPLATAIVLKLLLSSLADLAKAMLERTRKLETDMRRSEEEAKALRRSLEQARREAEIDHMTGLPNRRAFEAVLEREYRDARSSLDPLAVAFCDIDHFKRINDTHGHDAGDRVIRLIAEMLATISDDNCHVARHGGEEFVMLFRGVSLSEAHKKLDGLREQMAERRLRNRKTDEPLGQITFSAGIADVFDFPDPRAALKAADEALYAAKQGGRNKVMIAPKGGTEAT